MLNENEKIKSVVEEYASGHPMTIEEKDALYEWVKDGNSPYDNPCMACDDHGNPLDFLSVYRYEKEIVETIDNLAPEERDKYVARLKGEDTMETLKEDLYEAIYKLNIYEKILRSYGLMELAEQRIKAGKEYDEECKKLFIDCNEELPF